MEYVAYKLANLLIDWQRFCLKTTKSFVKRATSGNVGEAIRQAKCAAADVVELLREISIQQKHSSGGFLPTRYQI